MSERTEKRVDMLGRLRGAPSLATSCSSTTSLRWTSVAGAVIGVEALLRWNDREHGDGGGRRISSRSPRTPGSSCRSASGVLREACRQAKLWLDAGLGPITMAVNLSARQFRQENLVQMVSAILGETGLPPGHLELEITESTMMHRAEEAAAAACGPARDRRADIAG